MRTKTARTKLISKPGPTTSESTVTRSALSVTLVEVPLLPDPEKPGCFKEANKLGNSGASNRKVWCQQIHSASILDQYEYLHTGLSGLWVP